LRVLERHHPAVAAENMFLLKQLALYQERRAKPRRLDPATRVTLVLLSRWLDWRSLLLVVQPDTLVRWHRQGWRLFWRWKSRAGRPPIPVDLQRLIVTMARAYLTCGEERIADELLLKLGLTVAPRTVGRYLRRLRLPRGGRPSAAVGDVRRNHVTRPSPVTSSSRSPPASSFSLYSSCWTLAHGGFCTSM
jgi:putative transposase